MSRESILKANDLKREPIEVPEWGGTFYIREMSGVELPHFQAACAAAKEGDLSKNIELMAVAVALCLCDADGKREFELADVEALKAKNYRVLERVSLAALRLSGLDAGAVDDAEKK